MSELDIFIPERARAREDCPTPPIGDLANIFGGDPGGERLKNGVKANNLEAGASGSNEPDPLELRYCLLTARGIHPDAALWLAEQQEAAVEEAATEIAKTFEKLRGEEVKEV